jgi:hypothetical protein
MNEKKRKVKQFRYETVVGDVVDHEVTSVDLVYAEFVLEKKH